MYPNQYVDLLKNGPDNSTVITGYGYSYGVNGLISSEFGLNDNMKVVVKIGEINTIVLYKNNNETVYSHEITDDFGYKWLEKANDLYNFEPTYDEMY